MRMSPVFFSVLVCAALWVSGAASAHDQIWAINAGYGPQTDSAQKNRMTGIDLNFFQYQHTQRQELSIGVSYTHIDTDGSGVRSIQALSVFPQLTLYGKDEGAVRPMFFVRALGPTWMTERRLGDREQGSRFNFQAQVGAGIVMGEKRNWMLTLSYKHFSNAMLSSPNESFDVPLLLTVGYRVRN